MLNRIKAIYFKRIIFSMIKEKIKLDIIKYNKYLQSDLKITLIDYKNVSGKYIIYDGKGRGEEFSADNDHLLFEGEYKNGKRNGSGIEYHEYWSSILFKGEYKNGKRNGKGKEYQIYGKKRFEGEYFNGKKWNGFGNRYDISKSYEIKNGKGYVKESNYDDNLFYEGEYLNGERHGKGKEYDENITFFEGEYLHGKKWNGISYNFYCQEVGELKNGKGDKIFDLYECKGEVFKYIGQYLNGEKKWTRQRKKY